MDIRHSGFDAIYVAFQGALSGATQKALEAAKLQAICDDDDHPCTIDGIKGVVKKNGAQGGYTYLFDTGPDGEVWKVKRSDDVEQWNLFVEVRAATCAELGWSGVWSRIWEQLDAFRARVMTHAINRVDFCVDVETSKSWTLDPARFAAHSRSTATRHYEMPDEVEGFRVVGLDRVTSLTIGRNPGRVVQVYDKRHEQRCKPGFWHEIWGTTKEDCPPIWRTEIRLHAKHLKDWNIRTQDDAEAGMLDVFKAAINDVRYVSSRDISNISRAELDPLWMTVIERVCEALFGHEDGRERGRIVRIKRAHAEEQYSAQMRGMAAGLSVVCADRIDDDGYMAEIARDMIQAHVLSDKWKATKRRAQKRFHFIEEDDDVQDATRAA